MRTLMFHGRRDFRIEERAAPEATPGHVVIRVAACGICGSDVHEFTHGPETGTPRRVHPQTGTRGPIVGGHEIVGTIAAIGAEVRGLDPGQRVAVRPTLPCRTCSACRRGRQSQCRLLATIGVSEDGGLADFVRVRADCAYPLPDSLADAQAAYAEPLACAVHGLRRGGFTPGDRIGIVGAGPIGLMTLLAARAFGATDVALFEPSPFRRALATELGATSVHDPGREDAVREHVRRSGGERPALVLECAGALPAFDTALSLAGRGGRLVLLGMIFEQVHLRPLDLFMREQAVIGSMGYDDRDFEVALELLVSGRVAPHPRLTTAEIGLSAVLEQGFDALTGTARLEHCKIQVHPDG